ncbi:nucleoside-diphosphate sugar epimerase/dehydratase [Qipengyuania sp. JC766]|uniref:polysaccharide biosynthesis protein n=1 Tax=Qipengyuania sp. JC766 TaxID=3232139 RepID=UPI00345A657F
MKARPTEFGISVARGISASLLRADRNSKRLLAVAVDVLCCIVAVLVSFSIRLGYWEVVSPAVGGMIVAQVAMFLPIFYFGGVYSNLFRFHGPRGMTQLAFCCAVLAIPSVVIFGVVSISGVPRTLSILFPLVFFALVALSRIIARYVLVDLFGERNARRNVLIYGAGSAGRQLAASIAHEREYRLIGYLDADPALAGRKLEGVPIFSTLDMESALERHGIEIVLLAVPSMPRSTRAKLVERLQDSDIHVLTLPALGEIVDGKVSVSDLRPIDVADLLSRDPVEPDPALMSRTIEGKCVLVTGAGGSIGGELSRQILVQRPERIVLVEMTEAALYAIDGELRTLATERNLQVDIVPELASVDNAASARRILTRYRPHTVYHAAAYKHVPMVEANVVSGVSNNVRGTLNCALAACEIGVERFILVSTDKAVRPTNVMGASKRVCEMILQALSRVECPTVFSMVRFGNVLGSSGSVVPRFREQIAHGGPVSITHRDITRYFMTIPEAAGLVIQAGAMARGGEVYLLDMGQPVKIMDLARTMIRLSGRTVRGPDNPDGDIEIVETGLRPGEKLYEELLIGAEAHPTEHPRIFQAQEDFLPWVRLEGEIARLDAMASEGEGDAIRAKLRELVPGFRPSDAEQTPGLAA